MHEISKESSVYKTKSAMPKQDVHWLSVKFLTIFIASLFHFSHKLVTLDRRLVIGKNRERIQSRLLYFGTEKDTK